MTIKASQCRALFAISYLHLVEGETEEVERWDRVVFSFFPSLLFKIIFHNLLRFKSINNSSFHLFCLKFYAHVCLLFFLFVYLSLFWSIKVFVVFTLKLQKFIASFIYQYIKDCEAGAGRTPTVRRRK